MQIQNQCTAASGAVSTALPGSSVSGYTRSALSVVLVCPLHTFTNDSRCHLPPNVPAVPATPAPIRVLTCRRAHTQTLAHTRVHTHPRPGSAQEADCCEASPARPPRGGWCRAPRPHLSCHRGRRAPRRPRKLLATAGVPPNAEASPAPISLGASVPLTARVTPEPQNLNRGRRGGRGGSLFLTFCVGIPPWIAGTRVGVGGAPIFKAASGLSGRGSSCSEGEPRERQGGACEAERRPAGTAGAAPRPPRAPGPRSSREATCSRPAGSRALTAVPSGTRRPRCCSSRCPPPWNPGPCPHAP